MPDLRVTYLQTNLVWQDRDANRKNMEEKIKNIRQDYDVVILPEMFDTGFSMTPEKVPEQKHNKTLAWMKEMAQKHDTAICGSIMTQKGKHYFNRFYWVDPSAHIYHYDKKHLFRMGDEPKHYTAGKDKTIIHYKGWKILPLVCYDLRFPVWSANQLEDDSIAYDLLIYVANWPAVRSQVWTALLQARALENQAYCIGVNRVGKDGNNLEYSGDSIAFDAKGRLIAQSAPFLEDQASFRLDKQELDDFRKRFPVSYDWDKFKLQ